MTHVITKVRCAMDSISAVIEIFVVSLAVAVFGGTALLIALEAKTPRLALKANKVGVTPVADTAHQVDWVGEPANAGHAGNVSKVA